MPWDAEGAKKHNSKLSTPQAKIWVRIANEVLKSCLAENGKDCEARAIKIANSHFQKKSKRKLS